MKELTGAFFGCVASKGLSVKLGVDGGIVSVREKRFRILIIHSSTGGIRKSSEIVSGRIGMERKVGAVPKGNRGVDRLEFPPPREMSGGEEFFGHGKATEEDGGVKGIASEGVAEVGKASEVASGQARGGFGVEAADGPHSEIGEHVKLCCAEKHSAANADYGAGFSEPAANRHAEREAGVHGEH